MAAIGTAQSSAVADRARGRRPPRPAARSGAAPPTRSSRVSSTSWAPVICTGSSRAPDQPGVGVGDDLAHQVGAGARCWASWSTWARTCSTGTPSVGRRGLGGDGGDLGADRGVARARRRRGRRCAAVSKATRCRYQPPAARARQTAATKNSKPARPRRTGRVSRIRAVACDRAADPPIGPARRCRRCCGAGCAGAARGAAAGVRSSPAGSPSRTTCRTCGIGWHRGYEGFELGAMAISAVVVPRACSSSAWRSASSLTLARHRGGPAAAHPRRRRRSSCRSSSYPRELHGLAGRRPGDAPAGAGRRRAAAALTVAAVAGCLDEPLFAGYTRVIRRHGATADRRRSRCDTPSVGSPPSGRRPDHTTRSTGPRKART